MKRSLFLIVLVGFVYPLLAQNDPPPPPPMKMPAIADAEGIYKTSPHDFIYNNENYYAYIGEIDSVINSFFSVNTEIEIKSDLYPVRFVVNAEGRVDSVNFPKPIEPTFEKAISAGLKGLEHNFKPLRVDGKAVSAWNFSAIHIDIGISNGDHYMLPPPPPPPLPPPPPPSMKTEEINYMLTEKLPEYPGGNSALTEEVGRKYNVPEGVDYGGKVVLKFLVTKEGEVGEIQVLKSPDPLLSAEGVRVLQNLKYKFTPGMQKGEAVNVWYVLPLNIQFEDSGNTDKRKRKRRRK